MEHDWVNPSFHVGLMFNSVERLREVIIDYSVRNMVEIKLVRNDRTSVRAHRVEKCSWNSYAPYDTRAKSFVVKTYYGKHSC